jgi:hypothetical protein
MDTDPHQVENALAQVLRERRGPAICPRRVAIAISKLSATRRAFSSKIDAAARGQTSEMVCSNSASQQRILADPVVEPVDEFANHCVVDAGAFGDLVDGRGATIGFSRHLRSSVLFPRRS